MNGSNNKFGKWQYPDTPTKTHLRKQPEFLELMVPLGILVFRASPEFVIKFLIVFNFGFFSAIGRTLIPRYFRSIFEGGVTELYYNLKHPKESFHNTSITLDCEQCSMVTHHGKPMFTKVCRGGGDGISGYFPSPDFSLNGLCLSNRDPELNSRRLGRQESSHNIIVCNF